MTPRTPCSRVAVSLTGLALAALVVAGCSSGGGTPTTSGVATDRVTESVAPASAAPAAVPVDGTVRFDGVTVGSATDLSVAPHVTSTSASNAAGLAVQDVVIGTGAPAAPDATVTVQYVGVLYRNGTAFDSSRDDGPPQPLGLSSVVPGFREGIGGTAGVAPMRVGGRRIMIFPAALGYGDQATGPIPAGSSLVFVVDLTKVQ